MLAILKLEHFIFLQHCVLVVSSNSSLGTSLRKSEKAGEIGESRKGVAVFSPSHSLPPTLSPHGGGPRGRGGSPREGAALLLPVTHTKHERRPICG